jgi:hypothetical protein
MKISFPVHCGNSPKKILLIDLYKAVTTDDYDFILSNLEDKVRVNIVGDGEIRGKENVVSVLRELVAKGLKEIEINDAITHGNTAAVHGVWIFNNELRLDFCDVYRFKGFGKKAKIGEITSYLINPGHHKIF